MGKTHRFPRDIGSFSSQPHQYPETPQLKAGQAGQQEQATKIRKILCSKILKSLTLTVLQSTMINSLVFSGLSF